MKVIKYEFTGKDKYNVFLDNGEVLTLYENVITDNEVLLKKEINKELYHKLIFDNSIYENYLKAIKYINIRLRSIKEIKDYLNKKGNSEYTDIVIAKLIKNKYLDDERFALAYVKDKINLTMTGDYKIKMELQKLGITSDIIERALANIDEDILTKKMTKIIEKDLRTNKKYSGTYLKNKIYNHLVSQGYQKEKALNILNNYEF